MYIVVAPDSFKECLSARLVAENIASGIRKIMAEAEIIQIPIADGGEGTVEAIVSATGGKLVEAMSYDPLMRPIKSFYGVCGDRKTAVIEMASASGIGLLKIDERNPMVTTTFGTGKLIIDALESGYKTIILGIGGSATNDGGAGMAQAFGISLKDQNGDEIAPGGGHLHSLKRIDLRNIHPLIIGTQIVVACDVTNPLCGQNGASFVYGSQKGGTSSMIEKLDRNLGHFGRLIKDQLKIDVANMPGSGAAGGLGAGLMAFTNAHLKPGFEVIKSAIKLEDFIRKADLVFTAEGKIDFQTQFGKTPFGVAQLAAKYHIPVVALAGIIGNGAEVMYQKGITCMFSIVDQPMTLEESIAQAEVLLENTAERVMRAISMSIHQKNT